MKTRVIFASLILGLGLVANSATAATTIADDSPAAKKPASALLINGSEKQFSDYVAQRLSRLARQQDWQNFMNVIALYNADPVSVLNISVSDRDAFNQAASKVKAQLARQKDAGQWLKQADQTVRTINFLWNVDLSQAPLTETE